MTRFSIIPLVVVACVAASCGSVSVEFVEESPSTTLPSTLPASERIVPAEDDAATLTESPHSTPMDEEEDEDDEDVRFGEWEDGDLSGSSLKERYLVTALKLRKQRCAGTANSRAVNGVCLDKAECALKKGHKAGHCALLGSCCYFQHSCGQKSHYKVSHFASPPEPPSECDFRINVINRDVCQIRVDFEEFSLAQPERDQRHLGSEVTSGWRCIRDRFSVASGISGGSLGFEALCGENKGQHIYIPVNATAGPTSVRLLFQLSNRTRSFNISDWGPAKWLLRITQLECAPAEYDYTGVHAALASAGHQVANKHVLAATDADLLAPQGCLQYYPERQGEYMSFNYLYHRYFSNLHYAICFRRRPTDCGIRHTAIDFRLDFNFWNDDYPDYINRYCDTRKPALYNYTGDDYLYVPNGILDEATASLNVDNTPFANKICGTALDMGRSIASYAPGPLFVYFHSDDITFKSHADDQGFRMQYEVQTTGCYIADPGTSSEFYG